MDPLMVAELPTEGQPLLVQYMQTADLESAREAKLLTMTVQPDGGLVESVSSEEASLVPTKDAILACTVENWSDSLLSSLRVLQLGGQLCDVTLVGSAKSTGPIQAHSSVLSASSAHLRELLSQQLQSSNEVTLEFPNIPCHLLQSTVDFLYSGEVAIARHDVGDLLELSEQLNIDGLSEVCKDLLREPGRVEVATAKGPEAVLGADEDGAEEMEDAEVAEVPCHFFQEAAGKGETSNSEDSKTAADSIELSTAIHNPARESPLSLQLGQDLEATSGPAPDSVDDQQAASAAESASLPLKKTIKREYPETDDYSRWSLGKEMSAESDGRARFGPHLGSVDAEGNHVCPCGSKFTVWHNLVRHMLHCQQKKRFVCPVEECGMKFRRREYITDHLVTVHSMDRMEAKAVTKEAKFVILESAEEINRKRAKRPPSLPLITRPRTRRQARHEAEQGLAEIKQEPTGDAEWDQESARHSPRRGRHNRNTRAPKSLAGSDADARDSCLVADNADGSDPAKPRKRGRPPKRRPANAAVYDAVNDVDIKEDRTRDPNSRKPGRPPKRRDIQDSAGEHDMDGPEVKPVVAGRPFKVRGLVSLGKEGNEERENNLKPPKREPKAKAPLICHICGHAFRHKKSLTLHEHKHRGTFPYTCKICNRGYMDGESYRNHVKGHSGNLNLRLCDICGLGCTTRNGLAKHVRVMHKGIVAFKCKDCGKQYRHRSSYDVHRRTHSTQLHRNCPTCKKVFLDASGLKRHMRIHTGEKPYACQFCGVCFNQGESRRKHELVCSRSPCPQGSGSAGLVPRRGRPRRQPPGVKDMNIMSLVKQEREAASAQVLLCEQEQGEAHLDIGAQTCLGEDGQSYVIKVIDPGDGSLDQIAAIQQLLPEGATLELEESEMVYQHVKEEVTLEGDVTWQMDNVDHVAIHVDNSQQQ